MSYATQLFLAALATLPAAAAQAALLNYNLVVTNNYNTNSHVQGRSFVNNLTLAGATVFADRQVAGNGDVLTVAGSITGPGTIALERGTLRTKSALPGNVSVNLNGGSNLAVDSGISISSLAQELSAYSVATRALTPNSTATKSGNNITFNLNFNAAGQAIVNLTAGLFSGSNLQISLPNIASSRTLLINVPDSSFSITNGSNFTGIQDSTAGRVLWNFYAANTISLDSGFYGAILGPTAQLNQNSSNITGGVYVSSLTQRAEIHVPDQNLPPGTPIFTGNVPIPEPTALAILAPLAVLLPRRRRA